MTDTVTGNLTISADQIEALQAPVVDALGGAPAATALEPGAAHVVGAGSVTVVPSNPLRKFLEIQALSVGGLSATARVSLHLGGGSAVLDSGPTFPVGGGFRITSDALYTGAVQAIGSEASIPYTITEF